MYRLFMVMVTLVTAVALESRTFGAVLDVPTATYPTIQSAIDAAVAGDEVVVAPGTYFESIRFNGKAITVRSTDGPAVTILDGTGLVDTLVRFVNNEGPNSVLEGFTITGGSGSRDFGAPPLGGGIFVFLSRPRIVRCVVTGNTATFGGGVYVLNGAPTFQSCVFTDNAANEGGALNSALSSTTITNCTIFGNTAQLNGGIFNSGPATVISNSILWGNSDDTGMGEFAQIHDPNAAVDVTYTIIQGIEAFAAGTGNLGDDPQFVDPANRDLHLLPRSPAIDAGNNDAIRLPERDLDGQPRRIDDGAVPDSGFGIAPIVDIGASEAPGDCDGNGEPDETDPDADGDGLIDACDRCPATPPGAAVTGFGCPLVRNVTQGTSFKTIQEAIDASVDGDEIALDPASYNETINMRGRAIRLFGQDGPSVTSIDGSTLGGSVITCDTGEGPNTVIEGLTITGGSASQGGGMLNNGSSPTVVNCRFEMNTAAFGGGMFNGQSSVARVINCTFIENLATSAGGGMANVEADPHVINCEFLDNFAQTGGGGLYANNANPIISGCTFFDNGAGFIGGGIFSDLSSPAITNSIFWRNTDSSGPTSSAQIRVNGGDPTLEYSCIQNGWFGSGGTGNITDDPSFVAAMAGDLRLSPGSPCIDAASNLAFMLAAGPSGVTIDRTGRPRFADDLSTSDTGSGFGLIMDMGAHEFNAPAADFNLSGTVDLFDFAKFLEMFTGPASP